MLILVASVSWLYVRAAMEFEIETEQKLNKTLAQDLAVVFQPWLIDKIDNMMIQMEIAKLMGIKAHKFSKSAEKQIKSKGGAIEVVS